jgi:hypothetical protein
MKITPQKDYILIHANESSFEEFFTAFTKQKLHTVTQHKIIELSENLNITVKDISLFLNAATSHKTNGISFVIICNGIDIDEIPDTITIVPTLTEAEDVIEMEVIERDLGF